MRRGLFSGQKGRGRIKVVTSYTRLVDHYRMWSMSAATTTHGSPRFHRQCVCRRDLVKILRRFYLPLGGRTGAAGAWGQRRLQRRFLLGKCPQNGLGGPPPAGLFFPPRDNSAGRIGFFPTRIAGWAFFPLETARFRCLRKSMTLAFARARSLRGPAPLAPPARERHNPFA